MTRERLHLVGAHGAAADRVVAWVGVAGVTTEDLRLTVAGRPHPIPDRWTTFASRSGDVRAQRVTIDGLAAGRTYPLALVSHGEVVASAEATTLPTALPSTPDRPFTVLLGSCFSVLHDPAGVVGAAIARLPEFARPHVTILSGDQVYLDSPAMHFLVCTHSREELEDELLSRYVITWSQRSGVGGFQRMLTAAGTFFSSDDHELWNNAPSPTPYVRDSWTAGGRTRWLAAATRLYELFQAARPGASFAVGRLSLFIADTRLGRTADGAAVMSSDQLAALSAWVRALPGPGALVLGQPIFVAETGWRGRVTDRGLADFRQYADLVRILSSTPHDIVVLTGDVHFGRVATCDLPSGRRLLEVIASPLALVHQVAAGKWGVAPSTFPVAPVPGVMQAPVSTASYRRVGEHFVTLGFSGSGAAVRMSATAWPIQAGDAPHGEPVMSTVLH